MTPLRIYYAQLTDWYKFMSRMYLVSYLGNPNFSALYGSLLFLKLSTTKKQVIFRVRKMLCIHETYQQMYVSPRNETVLELERTWEIKKKFTEDLPFQADRHVGNLFYSWRPIEWILMPACPILLQSWEKNFPIFTYFHTWRQNFRFVCH